MFLRSNWSIRYRHGKRYNISAMETGLNKKSIWANEILVSDIIVNVL